MSVGLTSDSWTFRTGDAYFILRAHITDEQFQRNCLTFEAVPFSEKHTSMKIWFATQASLKTWKVGQEHISGFVHDNAPNISAAVRFGCPPDVPCTDHTLHMTIKDALVRVRHLQHETFRYELDILNSASSAQTGTVRIFLAPRLNEIREPFELNDQRHLFMELDKFETRLNPGRNAISRSSTQSSVTLSSAKTFSQLIAEAEASEEQTSSCSCGLPDHLLLPKGKPEGMSFQLVVMVTNSNEDRVTGGSGQECQDAASYCGILNQLYPDKKPMGFPFDRRIEVASLNDFKTSNMNFADLIIRFRNEVVDTSGTAVFYPET